MLSAAKHLVRHARETLRFAQGDRTALRGTPGGAAAARQQCHAERSEASPCRARQTLRFAQGDRAALSVTPKGNTSPLRLNRPHDKHQPGWAYTRSAYHGYVYASM